MHALYNLKDMLCKELEEFGGKGELTAGSLETVDKLAHAIKNLDKIIEAHEEEEYSSRGGSYEDGMSRRSYRGGSYRYSREDGDGMGSYRGRGRSARRDSMGRYSGEGGYSRSEDMAQQLRNLADQARDERTRKDLHRLADQMEEN